MKEGAEKDKEEKENDREGTAVKRKGSWRNKKKGRRKVY